MTLHFLARDSFRPDFGVCLVNKISRKGDEKGPVYDEFIPISSNFAPPL